MKITELKDGKAMIVFDNDESRVILHYLKIISDRDDLNEQEVKFLIYDLIATFRKEK